MTDQPQSCRECRHAIVSMSRRIYCEWAWSNENLACPSWLLNEPPEVQSDDGADCPAFEPKDDADDE